MKTTIDIPDDLIRSMKIKAVQEGRKFKDVATEIFRRGLALSEPSTKISPRHRVKLPLITAKPGASTFELSGEKIHELEMESERESYDASLRH